jgi:NAD+ diphosphatase
MNFSKVGRKQFQEKRTMNFIPSYRYTGKSNEPAWWFAFSDFKLLVDLKEGGARIPCVEDLSPLGLTPLRKAFLGLLDGRPCYSAECGPDALPPEGMAFRGLRGLFAELGDELFTLAGRALQIVYWDRTHQFCSQCGTPTVDKSEERAKICHKCSFVSFPRMSPAIIVAVQKGDQILLARASRFPDGMYSVLAGFVEPGESLEQCVRREVKEEVGIEVKNIRYFGSQPWPFPNSLMVGFTAAYAGGKIRIDQKEIVDAGWFKVEKLPKIPDKISIARRLIDWFVAKHPVLPLS